MSDERDETRSFSPFDDATWADDAGRPGRGRDRSGDRIRRPPASDGNTRPQPAAADDASRRQSAAADDATRRQPAAADDETRPQSAAADDETRLQSGAADDATRLQAGAADDATRLPSAAGEASRAPAGRPSDATSVMPPVAENPAWAGRAEVRAPRPAVTTYQQEVDWPGGPGPQRPRDRWWMPILVGIIVLALLGVLGWGVYLIVQNAAKDDNTPAPAVTNSAPPAPTTAATTATTEPSSAPTTTTPTPTASTTDPTDDAVAIPALRGLTVADAKAALQGVGIHSTRVIYRISSGEPDTVIDSDPEEGQEVPPDTTVTLVVAAPSTATTNPTATATGTGTGN